MADPIPASSDIDLRPLVASLADLKRSVDLLRPKRASGDPSYQTHRITNPQGPVRLPGMFTSICLISASSSVTFATQFQLGEVYFSVDGSTNTYRLRRGMVLEFPEPVTGFITCPQNVALEIGLGLDVRIRDGRPVPDHLTLQSSAAGVALGAGATVTVCSVAYTGTTPETPTALPIQWRAWVRCSTAGNVRINGGADQSSWQEERDMIAGEVWFIDTPTHIPRTSIASGHSVRAISSAGFVGVVSASLRVMAR